MLLPVIYIAFISLGLPDSMLGSAWPSMYRDIGVPESYAGLLTAIIYGGTIISSLMSGFLTNRFSTKVIVLFSILLTAVSMFGFSISGNYVALCCFAFPYGLGGGCIDATLNNYVAIHYKPMHMNFLHCFWGIGTVVGPLVMGNIIAEGGIWSQSYRVIAMLQLVIAAIILMSFPLWKKSGSDHKSGGEQGISLWKSLSRLLCKPGIKGSIAAFFCYCAVESTLGLWTVSYMVGVKDVDIITATSFGMVFFVGITVGRIVAGILSQRFSDMTLIVSGIVLVIILLMVLTLLWGNVVMSYIMVGAVGIGCGPVFPCMLHRAPDIAGRGSSSILIGAQMAAASLGSITIPALFGYIIHIFNIGFLPFFCMVFMMATVISLNNWNYKSK